MLPFLSVGPFLLQLPGLAILFGGWVGISLTEKYARRRKIDHEAAYNLVLVALISGIAGARLGYVASHLGAYLSAPLSVLALKNEALSLPFGLAVALLTACWYGYRRKLPLLPTLDAVATGAAGMAVFIGIAHLLSGDAFGKVTSLPWAIYLWDAYRHPSQIYEIVYALAVLGAIFWFLHRGTRDGEIFYLTTVLMSAGRLFLDAFRGDSPLTTGGFRIPQLVSLGILLLAWAAYAFHTRKNTVNPKEEIL